MFGDVWHADIKKALILPNIVTVMASIGTGKFTGYRVKYYDVQHGEFIRTWSIA